MRAVVQRVSDASVKIAGNDGETVAGEIGEGILVYLGVGKDDDEKDAGYMAAKIANLRIFMDDEGKMNLSALDLGCGALVVSQFTLYADCAKGRRPSFSDAAPDAKAEALYGTFCSLLRAEGLHVETGRFKEIMRVRYTNEGPVTVLVESVKRPGRA